MSWILSSFAVGVVQVRASQGRRGRDTGSYVDRGERREVRAWAARTVKRLRLHDTMALTKTLSIQMGLHKVLGVQGLPHHDHRRLP